MKKYTPQALAAAEKWARLTTGFLAALFLFYAYWMLADLELVPTPAFLAGFPVFQGSLEYAAYSYPCLCGRGGILVQSGTGNRTGSAGIHHSHCPADPAGG